MKNVKMPKKFKRSFKKSVLLTGAFVIVVSCFVFSFIKISSDIEEEKQMVDSLAQQCDELEAENAELQDMLDSGDEDAYIERVARENGYVMPNEREYVDISADE